jgi:DNA-binding response OmpR family regulator
MTQPVVVLLVPDDPLTGLLTLSRLLAYGYEVLLASDPAEAEGLLEAHRRIGALVVNADLPAGRVLAKSARELNPKTAVVYTSRVPHRIPESDKVPGAPCLRVPYHAHQLVGLLGQLTGRAGADDEARVA